MKRIFNIIVTLLMVIGTISLVLVWVDVANNSNSYVRPVYQDPDLLAVLQSVGAKDYSKLYLGYVESFENEHWAGTYSNNIIQIKTGLDPFVEKTAIAHEYLHYLWFTNMSDGEKNRLIPEMLTISNTSEYMKLRINSRKTNGTYTDLELFPMLCTEIKTIGTLEDICNKYIDRTTLTKLID